VVIVDLERFATAGARTAFLHHDLSALIPREWEVLEALARGHGNAEPAERVGCSEATVKTHAAHVTPHSGPDD